MSNASLPLPGRILMYSPITKRKWSDARPNVHNGVYGLNITNSSGELSHAIHNSKFSQTVSLFHSLMLALVPSYATWA